MSTPFVCILRASLFVMLSVLLPAVAAASSQGRFSVPLHRQRVPVIGDTNIVSYKSVYFGNVAVGYPNAQQFTVVFDTGSAHLILPSVECRSDTCRVHQQYERRASAYAWDIDHDGSRVLPGAARDQVTIAFGTGEVTGVFVQDRVCLGEAQKAKEGSDAGPQSEAADAFLRKETHPALQRSKVEADPQCVDMRVVTATEMSHEPFHAFAFDGILGLSLDSLALAPEFSVFGMLADRGKLAHPSFGVFLGEGDEEVSEISFGGFDPEKIQGEPVWAPVYDPELGHWQVQINSLRLGNQTLDFCADGLCRAVVDTGTSLLAVPESFADDLQTMLEDSLTDPPLLGAAFDGVDCRQAIGLPLHFDVAGFTITLQPGDYTRQALQMEEDGTTTPVEIPLEESPDGGSTQPSRRCWPTLMPIDFPEPLGPKLFIWGEPVLRKYYTAYDWQRKSVGFGLASHAGAAAAAPRPQGGRKPLLF